MSSSLAATTTVITGASSGIGTAVARRFAGAGSRVVLAARRLNRLEALAATLREEGCDAFCCRCDVSRYEDVAALVEQALTRYGQIDVMVNNAGNAVAKPVAETSPEELDLQIDVNFKGVCYGCRAVAPHMIERGTGTIVNIGSICSLRHFPNYAAYVGAKFAVLGFSRSFYEEVRPHGVRVTTLCPAAVNTAWGALAGAEQPWPPQELLQPEDLAEMAYFCVTAPARVQVESVVAWPRCEPTA